MDWWELLRDVGTWGSGIALIFWEAARPSPNEYVLGAAVVLIAPAPEVDEMLDSLSPCVQAIFRRSLTADEQTALDASLDAATPKAP